MPTRQPVWKFVANLGDVNPVDYGGYFVYTDETGEYDAEGEKLFANPDYTDEPTKWTVYRFSLDRLTDVNGSLVNARIAFKHAAGEKLPYAIESYNEWFVDDLTAVASFIGRPLSVLRVAFTSEDVLERAFAYEAIGEYHGFENLDGYPLHFADRAEVEKRYSERNKQ